MGPSPRMMTIERPRCLRSAALNHVREIGSQIEGAGLEISGMRTRPCQRRGRLTAAFAALHESVDGTTQTSHLISPSVCSWG